MCDNYLFTSSISKIVYLYNPIFGIGELENNYFLGFTSFLGGNLLGSWNTPLYAYNKSSWYFFPWYITLWISLFLLIHSLYLLKKALQFSMRIDQLFHLVKSYHRDIRFNFVYIDDKLFTSLIKQYNFSLLMKFSSIIYMYGPSNTIPHTSRGITSNYNLSVKATIIKKLILHYLVTLISTWILTHPNEYQIWCSCKSNSSFLSKSSTMKFPYELKSFRASDLVFLY